MQYVVVHSFQDKYTKKYYGVGSIYETSDEQRAMDLENGGYIVPDNTEAAAAAKAIAKGEQFANQNSEEYQKAYQQIKQEAEAKTVVNGKVVSLKAAQAAQAAFSAKNTQTGIQPHHANNTEAVPAGGLAQQKNIGMQQARQQEQQGAINQANVQSGQSEVAKELQAGQSSSPNEASNAEAYNNQAIQGASMGAYTSQQYQQEQSQQAQQQRNQAAQAAAARAEQTNAAEADNYEAAAASKAARTAAKTNAKSKGNE